MKKILIFSIFTIFTILGYGQIYSPIDCGELKHSNTETEWETIDTIGFNPKGEDVWIYSKTKTVSNISVTLEFNPCKVSNHIEIQYRVNDIGIVQQKKFITKYWYDKTIHPYNAKINQLKNRE
jgi:hypothetical protein